MPAPLSTRAHQVDQPAPDGHEDGGGEEQERQPDAAGKVWFPAAFSDSILRFIGNSGLLPHTGVIIDPFAGIGRIHRLASASLRTVGVEIEPEWAACHRSTIVGNALRLPFGPESFDGAVTSPVYGNRMSDHHSALDGSQRRSYTHDLQRTTGDLGRQLHPDNAGQLYAWQPKYWRFHVRAWAEVMRVLRPGAPFVLNVSDFIRNGQRVPVTKIHIQACTKLGFEFIRAYPVETPRMRKGENHQARIDHEYVLHFRRP
jgi:DNA modification methylase